MPFNVSLATILVAFLASTHLLLDRSGLDISRPHGAKTCLTNSSVAHYDPALFVPNPPGCDAYIYGLDNHQSVWGGCNTFGCNPWVDCQTETAGLVYWCVCEDSGGTTATCWSKVMFAADGYTVTGVECQPNGCANDCQPYLWSPGNFYPCNC